jgi:hypothetical protein
MILNNWQYIASTIVSTAQGHVCDLGQDKVKTAIAVYSWRPQRIGLAARPVS